MKDAKVLELAPDTRCFIQANGDVTLVRGAQAMRLRAREVQKIVANWKVAA